MERKPDLNKILKRKKKEPHCTAVVLAAGSSTRMGQDKTVMSLGGVPVIVRTLRAFDAHPQVDAIIVVTREERLSEIAAMREEYSLGKITQVLIGGATRAESSLIGVSAVPKEAEYIAIHDAARPLVTEKVITDVLLAARDYRAAVPSVPSTDSLRLVEGVFFGGILDRDKVAAIQTPQIFSADLIKGALTYAVQHQVPITDDSSALSCTGFPVRRVDGDRNNIKLTTPEDVIFAEAILKAREAAQ